MFAIVAWFYEFYEFYEFVFYTFEVNVSIEKV